MNKAEEEKIISDLGFSQYQGKPKKIQPKTPDKQQGRDFFQTPNYATDLLIPFIPKWVTGIWECAAGHGKIVKRLENYGHMVYASDIMFTEEAPYANVNFLTGRPPSYWNLDKFPYVIITNPPFSLKKEFFYNCIEYSVPFALLIPFDMNIWLCDAFKNYGCQGLVPTRKIDYIPPSGKGSGAQFHSFWLTRGFFLPEQLTIVELSKEDKRNI